MSIKIKMLVFLYLGCLFYLFARGFMLAEDEVIWSAYYIISHFVLAFFLLVSPIISLFMGTYESVFWGLAYVFSWVIFTKVKDGYKLVGITCVLLIACLASSEINIPFLSA